MEETNTVEGQDSVAEGQSSEKNISVDDLLKRVEQLEKSKSRVLEESKEYKSKYMTLKQELESKEQQEVEKSGDLEKKLQFLQSKKQELESQYTSVQKTALSKEIYYQIAQNAPDAHDIKAVANQIDHAILDVDPSTLEVKGVAEAIDDLRKKAGWMFKKDVPNMQSKVPSYKREEPKSIHQMSSSEKQVALKQALGAFLEKNKTRR